MRVILGIDPGKKGGIGIITITDFSRTEYNALPMPSVNSELLETIHNFSNTQCTIFCYVEQIQYRPNQRGVLVGVTNYGRLLGYLEACHIPYAIVSPQRWKKHFNLQGKEKADSINLANQIFNKTFTKTQDGLAEALLIAQYGKEKGNE